MSTCTLKALKLHYAEIQRRSAYEKNRKEISPERLNEKRTRGKARIDFHKKRVELKNSAGNNSPGNEYGKDFRLAAGK